MSVRQFLRLPATLLTIHRMIREDCAAATADEHLRAFLGFHTDPGNPHYRARTWQKVHLADIRADDVLNFAPGEMAFMMHVSMEIEDPIVEYSHQNGEGFRFLLPSLARFMGKNQAEADYAREHGITWCESAWCAEERRHGNAFAQAIERLTGVAPARTNPNQPRALTADEDTALAHLVSREAAEWSSSSTYTVMAAHATGALQTLLRNLAQDEVKHLCILTAADVYLRGPGLWRRFGELLSIGARNYRGQQQRRSAGARMGAHRVTATEVVIAHLLMEWRVRRWAARLTLATLATTFEVDATLPALSATPQTAEELAATNIRLARNCDERLALARWPPSARRRALAH